MAQALTGSMALCSCTHMATVDVKGLTSYLDSSSKAV